MEDFRIREMECDGKKVPEKYIVCFNDYIDKVIVKAQSKKIVEYLKEIREKLFGTKCWNSFKYTKIQDVYDIIDNKIEELEK